MESHNGGLGHLDFYRDYGDIKVGYPQPVFHLVELFASKTAEWVLCVCIIIILIFKGEKSSLHISRLVAVKRGAVRSTCAVPSAFS